MNSPKRLARIAGFLYLLVAIFSAFAYFVDKKVYVSGDAAATARNVVAHSGLVRAAVVADLVQATVWVFLAMALYLLLNHVHKSAASAMVVFVAIGAAITLLNAVFEFEGLRVATGAVHLAASGAAGSNGQVLLLLDTQHYGFLIAQIFFGPVAGAAGVSGLRIRDVPQGAGRPARRRGRVLPRGHVRGVPDPRLRPDDQHRHHHPVSDRGSLHGRLPARDRCEDGRARRPASVALAGTD
jgi:hypothetical protein